MFIQCISCVQQALGPQNTYDVLGPVLKDSSEQLKKKETHLAPSFGYDRHDQPISQRWKLRSGAVKRLTKVKGSRAPYPLSCS